MKAKATIYLGVCLSLPTGLAAWGQDMPDGTSSQSTQNLTQPSSESLKIIAHQALTWNQDGDIVIQLQGPVHIEVSGAVLSADRGVIWLTRVRAGIFDAHHAQIALIGNASINRNGSQRSGPDLLATATIRGRIRITADQRLTRNDSQSELYRSADELRQRAAQAQVSPVLPDQLQPGVNQDVSQSGAIQQALPAERPVAPTQPDVVEPAVAPVSFHASNVEIPGDDQRADGQNVYVVLSGDVLLIQRRGNGDLIELQAQRVVLFTQLKSLRDLEQAKQFKRIEDAIESAYLEGDVRIAYTPDAKTLRGEQKLRADRVFYEFATDRAVLTDAVLHATDPRLTVPIYVRANTIHQLSLAQYQADQVQLTTSSFYTPSYAIAADRAYISRSESADNSERYRFKATDTTLRTFGVPIFYLPYAAGTMGDRDTALRGVNFGHNGRFGTFVQSNWGVYELLGQSRPANLDLALKTDYYGDRGPGGGLDATYSGGFVRPNTREPWTFEGQLTSFFVQDHGRDDLGGSRADVEPDDHFRGHALWQHQQFFPEDWQLQLRAGWVSDATFLEQWAENGWDRNREHDVSAYIKRQRDTEAITLLLDVQPNKFVTISDMVQEQFEVERLPEVGYYRIGDSLGETASLFSFNRISALRYQPSDATLAEQGYYFGVMPGLPSVGQTGITDDTNIRGDFRQEVDFPLKLDQIRMTPYIMGRYTGYSESPAGGNINRFMAGAGVRLSTTFWNIDDTVRSDLFDLYRLRHVVEPELHLFTSAASTSADELYIYDEEVDKVYDISGASIGVRQRWQTKRGGPGRWRSVDFFTWNIFANFFANKPDDVFLNPDRFRGQYYWSLPEASIPRNSLNTDAAWRLTDTTVILSDGSYNLDDNVLATASIGVAVQRGDRLSYYAGMRYIEPIDANLVTLAASYQVSPKYTLIGSTSFGIGDDDRVYAVGSIQRHYDRFTTVLSIRYDKVEDIGGISFSVIPHGLGGGIGSGGFAGMGAAGDR